MNTMLKSSSYKNKENNLFIIPTKYFVLSKKLLSMKKYEQLGIISQ